MFIKTLALALACSMFIVVAHTTAHAQHPNPPIKLNLIRDADTDGVLGTSGDETLDSTEADATGDYALGALPGTSGVFGIVIELPPGYAVPNPRGHVIDCGPGSANPCVGALVYYYTDDDADGTFGSSGDTLLDSTSTDSNGDYTLGNTPAPGPTPGAALGIVIVLPGPAPTGIPSGRHI